MGERSKRVYNYASDAHFERTSIISTLGRDGFDATLTFRGTLNKEGFEVYIQNYLVPTLKFSDVVVMDNSSVQRLKGVAAPF